ncbi:hypothetical protein ACOMHN_060104 [Nucella lapillus]
MGGGESKNEHYKRSEWLCVNDPRNGNRIFERQHSVEISARNLAEALRLQNQKDARELEAIRDIVVIVTNIQHLNESGL